jgi:hypothetical protein
MGDTYDVFDTDLGPLTVSRVDARLHVEVTDGQARWHGARLVAIDW